MAKIIFYTNYGCPYAQRAKITLEELGLEYEEVIIDLGKPREPWYLEINPRGLVPSLSYDGHIIYESAVVTQFLADLKPSNLLPGSGNLEDALTRARVNFFSETFSEKFRTPMFESVVATDEVVRVAKANQLVDNIEKFLVPLLEGAAPFLGGSKEFTLAEANAAPFVIRSYAYSDPEAGLLPAFIKEKIDSIPVFKAWVDAVIARKSVNGSFDAESNIKGAKLRLAHLRK